MLRWNVLRLLFLNVSSLPAYLPFGLLERRRVSVGQEGMVRRSDILILICWLSIRVILVASKDEKRTEMRECWWYIGIQLGLSLQIFACYLGRIMIFGFHGTQSIALLLHL